MKSGFLAVKLCITSFCPAQTTKDGDLLQSLLAEVRQLRQAIEGMTIASQRVQIALAILQSQEALVVRDGSRVVQPTQVHTSRPDNMLRLDVLFLRVAKRPRLIGLYAPARQIAHRLHRRGGKSPSSVTN